MAATSIARRLAAFSGAAVLAVVSPLAAADGDLDPGFGVDGVALATTVLGDAPMALAVDGAGRLVAVGDAVNSTISSTFLVARFTPDGELDDTFDGDGIRAIGFTYGGATKNHATSVAIQPDGKVVVAGYATSADGNSTAGAVVRLTANGLPDGSFDDDGIAVLAVAGQNHAFHHVSVMPDSDIRLVGTYDDTVDDKALSLFEFDTAGNPGGFLSYDIYPTLPDRIGGVVLEPGGRMLIAVWASTVAEVTLVRLLSNGALDTDFGGDGLGHYPQAAPVEDVDVDRAEDGRYVLGVDFAGSVTLDWILPGGSTDPGVCTELPFCIFFGLDLAEISAQADGRVVAAGTNDSTGDVRAFRALEAGTLDPAFASAGAREFDCLVGAGASPDEGRALALSGGRAAVLGWRSGDANSDAFCLARLTSNLLFASGVEGGDLWGWSTSAP